MESELYVEDQTAKVSTIDAIRWSFTATGFAKLGKGTLLMLIPLVGPIVLMGWSAETHRRLVRREEPAIRDFQFAHFGRYLQLGLAPFLVQMLVSLILTVPISVFFVILAAVIPAVIIGSEGNMDTSIFMIVMAVISTMIFLGSFASLLLIKPMQIRVELSNDFGKAFELGAVLSFIKRQWMPMLFHSVVLSLLSLPLMLLGLLACYFGIFFVAVALQFAQLHLRWQIYERDLQSGAPAIVLAEDPST